MQGRGHDKRQRNRARPHSAFKEAVSNPLLLAFNKPYGVLSQFSGEKHNKVLADYIDQPGVYPAGRLDKDSEGLLLLTNDGKLQARISDPAHKLAKTYWAQVEGIPDQDKILALCKGVKLKDGLTRPAQVQLHGEQDPDWLWMRNPPIRERKNITTSWLILTIKEGKNRQVRRMTAAIGHPTLRLIRTHIGPWDIFNIEQGKFTHINTPWSVL